MADPARPALLFVLRSCPCMRRRTICVEATDEFRVAVLRYVREHMTAAYGDAAGERLRDLFGRKEWRELEAKVSARRLHVDTHPADAFVLAPSCGEEHCVAMTGVREGIVVRAALYLQPMGGWAQRNERLRAMYGRSATVVGPVMTWHLADGSTARLDAGPADVLVVERSAE